ncbi:DNA-binding transcriptional LysR family regulator [Pararhizobium capsulatum DSM 1112]|uniref:DNA-binding transcriptional LysR family regulator n=1 Tax=Pararhizobium capsulatum DSM 1112 TaxID=1121113 RepID=A0ABU0BMP2_9HYPH|nr:LysR family transcriptional regulator [Pararhizobium capsulatum]MDQ0319527.1 DNA-binding transcriptional LysR family regulator [Pararhizobium capsulatum DSM 1112]
MDNRAGEMEVFALAAELKSFSAAGRRLKLSPSAVSKLVTRIEDRLGTRLLVRTTRSLQLTPEGEIYLARARSILADIAETELVVSSGGQAAPRGLLRVNALMGFGERYILPIASEFLALYPHVQLDLSLTDGVIDLVEERTDIAIRSGALRDSSLKARKLLETRRVLVATPGYLDVHGTPRTPDDLDHHNCLDFNFRRARDGWPFIEPSSGSESGPESSNVVFRPINGNMLVNSGVMMRQICLAGIGIGRIGYFHVQRDIEEGRLVMLLEDHRPKDEEVIQAVFAGHDHLAARIRAFIDFLVERIDPAADGQK